MFYDDNTNNCIYLLLTSVRKFTNTAHKMQVRSTKSADKYK